MPLIDGEGNQVITAHASKQSKVSLKFTEVHTSVLVPILIMPIFPFPITVKVGFAAIVVLILLERRGWTLGVALKRLRSRLAGRYRFRKTRRTLQRRIKY